MKKATNVIVIILSILLIGFVEILSIIPNIILNSAVTIGAFAISMLIISITMIIQIKKVSNVQEKENIRDFWLKILFIIYILLLVTVLFFNNEYRMYGFENIKTFSKEHFEVSNIVPFRTIIGYILNLICYNNISIAVMNLGVNLLLFAPMGFFIPLLFKDKIDSFIKFSIIIAGSSLLVELLQFITYTGATDIDDIILNTIGAIIFYYLMKTKVVKNILEKIIDISEI